MSSSLEVFRFYRVFLPLWIVYACYTISRRPLSVVRAEIQRDTGLTAAHTSLIDTVFTVTYTIGQLNYGYFTVHFNKKQILLFGLLCSILCFFLVVVSSSLWIFCLAWSINGFCQAAGWATCVSILNMWMRSEECGYVMGWWSTNMAVGGVIGNVLPALLVSRGASWRAALTIEAFLLIFVISCISLALMDNKSDMIRSLVQQEKECPSCPDVPKCNPANADEACKKVCKSPVSQRTGLLSNSDSDNENSSSAVECDREGKKVGAFSIFCHEAIRGICVSNFLHKLVRYTFIFWLPYYVIEELKFSTAGAGCISALFDVGGVVGTIFSGYCSDKMFHGVGRTRVVLLFTGGMFLATLTLAVFQNFFSNAITLFSVNVFFVGFFAFGIDALITGSFLLDVLQRSHMTVHAGAVSGVVGGMGSAGSIFQGVFTVILSSSSWSVLFYSLGVSTLLGGLCLYRPLMMEMAKKNSVLPVILV